MYELPNSVIVNGRKFAIRGKADYRVILDVIAACQDTELEMYEQTITALTIFYEGINDYDDVFTVFSDISAAVTAMTDLISMEKEEIGYRVNHKLIDWQQDEYLIVSAVNNAAHTEIRAIPYMHWWTFISHYMAIGECALSTIVGIRDKIARGKKLEKHEQEFRRQNPQYFRWKTEERQAQNLFDELWNKK